MEKYAVEDKDLIDGLRNEEHELMIEVSHYMSGQKTADDEQRFSRAQTRLQSIRDKITEVDLGRKNNM
jgi:hypothetical protein